MPCSFSPPARRMCPRRCAPPRSGRIRFRSRASFPAVTRPFPRRRARCIRSFRTESASRRGRRSRLRGRPGRSFSAPRSFCACARSSPPIRCPCRADRLCTRFPKRLPGGTFPRSAQPCRRRAARLAMPRRAATLSGRRRKRSFPPERKRRSSAPRARDISPRTGRTAR